MSFQDAANYVKNLPKDGAVKPTQEQQLSLYGLYKQATEGDNNNSRPWAVQFEACAKHDAWDSRKGMSKEDAGKEYARVLTEIVTAATGKDWK